MEEQKGNTKAAREFGHYISGFESLLAHQWVI